MPYNQYSGRYPNSVAKPKSNAEFVEQNIKSRGQFNSPATPPQQNPGGQYTPSGTGPYTPDYSLGEKFSSSNFRWTGPTPWFSGWEGGAPGGRPIDQGLPSLDMGMEPPEGGNYIGGSLDSPDSYRRPSASNRPSWQSQPQGSTTYKPDYSMAPPTQLGEGNYQAIMGSGLQTGQNILESMLNREYNYPEWWGDKAMAPQQFDFYQFLQGPQYQGIQLPGEYNGRLDPGMVADIRRRADNMQFRVDPRYGFKSIDPSVWGSLIGKNEGLDYDKVDAPDAYNKLLEGDYDRLETALRDPAQRAATNAYEQGQTYLNDLMTGRGMYGSSVMTEQANEGLNKKYMDSMADAASQAVAQRYGLQQGDEQFAAQNALQLANFMSNENRADLAARQGMYNNLANIINNQMQENMARGQYGLNLAQGQLGAQRYGLSAIENLMGRQLQNQQFGANYGLQRGNLARQNAMDMYQTRYNDTMRRQNYLRDQLGWYQGQSEAQRDFYNKMLQGGYQHQLGQDAWRRGIDMDNYNMAMNLMGSTMPLYSNAQQYSQYQDALDQQQTGNFWRTIGNVASFPLGGGQTVGGQLVDVGGNLLKSGWDWVMEQF